MKKPHNNVFLISRGLVRPPSVRLDLGSGLAGAFQALLVAWYRLQIGRFTTNLDRAADSMD